MNPSRLRHIRRLVASEKGKCLLPTSQARSNVRIETSVEQLLMSPLFELPRARSAAYIRIARKRDREKLVGVEELT